MSVAIPALAMGLAQGDAGRLCRGAEIRLVVFSVVLFSILVSSLLLFLQERGWLKKPAALPYPHHPEP